MNRIIDVSQARIPSLNSPIDNGDLNWIAANIPVSLSMFGLQGTGANVKKWATGTATFNSSGILTITGLSYTPTIVFGYATTTNPNAHFNLFFGTASADIYDNSSLFKIAYIDKNTSGTVFAFINNNITLASGGFTATTPNGEWINAAVKWYALE